MSLTHKFLTLILIFLLVSLACSGVEEAAPRTDLPPETPSVTLVPLETVTLPTLPTPVTAETATVAHVIDGDTVELADGRRVRYIGINTPERDQPYYTEASAINEQLVAGKTVQLEQDVELVDRYGRTLAYVWADGQLVNLEIVRRGFASAFTVPPNVRYEEMFRRAEQEARATERGLWAGSSVPLKIIHIEANAPGDDRENPNGEWIEMANQGDQAVQMRGYTLKDEANNIYTFGDFTLRPGRTFRLYSGQGEDSGLALYWGLVGESVWNNSADSAFLRDAEGALVDSYAY